MPLRLVSCCLLAFLIATSQPLSAGNDNDVVRIEVCSYTWPDFFPPLFTHSVISRTEGGYILDFSTVGEQLGSSMRQPPVLWRHETLTLSDAEVHALTDAIRQLLPVARSMRSSGSDDLWIAALGLEPVPITLVLNSDDIRRTAKSANDAAVGALNRILGISTRGSNERLLNTRPGAFSSVCFEEPIRQKANLLIERVQTTLVNRRE